MARTTYRSFATLLRSVFAAALALALAAGAWLPTVAQAAVAPVFTYTSVFSSSEYPVGRLRLVNNDTYSWYNLTQASTSIAGIVSFSSVEAVTIDAADLDGNLGAESQNPEDFVFGGWYTYPGNVLVTTSQVLTKADVDSANNVDASARNATYSVTSFRAYWLHKVGSSTTATYRIRFEGLVENTFADQNAPTTITGTFTGSSKSVDLDSNTGDSSTSTTTVSWPVKAVPDSTNANAKVWDWNWTIRTSLSTISGVWADAGATLTQADVKEFLDREFLAGYATDLANNQYNVTLSPIFIDTYCDVYFFQNTSQASPASTFKARKGYTTIPLYKTLNFPTPNGKKFAGWHASKTAVSSGTTYSSTSDVTASDGESQLFSIAVLSDPPTTTYYLYPVYVDDTGTTGWVVEDGKIYYLVTGTKQKGIKLIDGEWYYLDPTTGELLTGFYDIDGETYYFDPDNGGARAQSGHTRVGSDYYYFDPNHDGAMVRDASKTTNGRTYLYGSNGKMRFGEFYRSDSGDWYYLGADGQVSTGWTNTSKGRRYFDPSDNNIMADDGLLKIGNDWYYFENSTTTEPGGAYAASDFRTVDGKTYYFGSDGKRLGGWQNTDRGRRYFDPTTHVMACDGRLTIANDGTYFFYDDGHYATNEFKDYQGGKTYYGGDGRLVSGWYTTVDGRRYFNPSDNKMACSGKLVIPNDGTYFFYSDGHYATDTFMDDGDSKVYYDANGRQVSGWCQTTLGRRYFNPNDGNRMACNGWLAISSDGTYYFNSDGSYVTSNFVTLGSDKWYCDANGRQVSGWYITPDGRRYFDPNDDNKMARNKWVDIGETRYYFYNDGTYPTDKIETIDGKKYYFYPSGNLMRNMHKTIDGVRYKADADGVLTVDPVFTIKVDNNHYYHWNGAESALYGFRYRTDYKISAELWAKLTQGCTPGEIATLQGLRDMLWGGSCFGVSATMGLVFNNIMSITEMTDSGATCYYNLPVPYTETKCIDVINYFMISQHRDDISYGYISKYYPSVTSSYSNIFGNFSTLHDFLEILVKNPTDEDVRMFTYGYTTGVGHAILAVNVEYDEPNHQYDVWMYDMNTFVPSTGGYYSHFYVKDDFNSFSYEIVGGGGDDGTGYLEDDCGRLGLLSLEQFRHFVPSNVILASPVSPSPVSGDSSGSSSLDDGNMIVCLPSTRPVTITNEAGENLSVERGVVNGTMPIYAEKFIYNDADSQIVVEVKKSKLTVASDEDSFSLFVRDDNNYLSVDASSAEKATLNLDESTVEIIGDNTNFEVGVLTDQNDGEGLVKVAATTTEPVTISKDQTEVVVSTDGELKDVAVTQFNGADSYVLDVDSTHTEDLVVDTSELVEVINELPEDVTEEEKEAAIESLLKSGWSTERDGKRYYENGKAVMGWRWLSTASVDDADWYYFDPAHSGAMAVGWAWDGYAWYLCDTEGHILKGWQWRDGKWYHMATDGSMDTEWLSDSGVWYWMGQDGAMAIGWANDGNNWYYMNADGSMHTGWQLDGRSWYYLNNTWSAGSVGKMTTGWRNIDGTWYYFKDNGAMVADDWVGPYYLTSSGAMARDTWIGPYHVGADGVWDATR